MSIDTAPANVTLQDFITLANHTDTARDSTDMIKQFVEYVQVCDAAAKVLTKAYSDESRAPHRDTVQGDSAGQNASRMADATLSEVTRLFAYASTATRRFLADDDVLSAHLAGDRAVFAILAVLRTYYSMVTLGKVMIDYHGQTPGLEYNPNALTLPYEILRQIVSFSAYSNADTGEIVGPEDPAWRSVKTGAEALADKGNNTPPRTVN